jgi:hypothetical protein
MASISGGSKLKAALDQIANKLEKGGTLRAGFLEGSTEADGTSVPLIAALNEFGVPSKGQPPRPFFRRAIRAHADSWPAGIAFQLKATNYDVDKTLRLTGEVIKGQIKQSILDLKSPPLAQSTIDRKGFDKPLIETATMLNSVDYEIKK